MTRAEAGGAGSRDPNTVGDGDRAVGQVGAVTRRHTRVGLGSAAARRREEDDHGSGREGGGE